MKKHRLGVFKYSCCAGCQFQLLYFQKYILETFEHMEVVFLKMAQSGGTEEGPFDLALIEGAVTRADQLKRVRKNSRWLLPIGSCAVNGGVPAIKNHTPELQLEDRVYEDVAPVHSMKAHPVDAYVQVHGYIKGCPMGRRDLLEATLSLLIGKKPSFFNYSVCVECKLKENLCVLVAHNQPCMGPVTNAGCGALCPSYNRACYRCWGPMEDANAQALEIYEGMLVCLELLSIIKPQREDSGFKVREGEGMALTEAPRGLLMHRYAVNKRGFIEKADLRTPTSHNFACMEKDLRLLVHRFPGQDESGDLKLKCEKLIRAYDPCFSCSVH